MDMYGMDQNGSMSVLSKDSTVKKEKQEWLASKVRKETSAILEKLERKEKMVKMVKMEQEYPS